MDNQFLPMLVETQKAQALRELEACNEISSPHGLFLDSAQIARVVEHRFASLRDTGRVELGQGVLKLLVQGFCDSPYLTRENYEVTLCQLQEAFYYFKSEAMERLGDEELIEYMRRFYDNVCQGSVEYMAGTLLEDLCRGLRYDGEDE